MRIQGSDAQPWALHHFRHRLGEETYLRAFDYLLKRLLESCAVKRDIMVVNSTHLKAYS